jgi:lipopolysaccharide/colanic/teichoic acid biosynthesis glycosyltransferase
LSHWLSFFAKRTHFTRQEDKVTGFALPGARFKLRGLTAGRSSGRQDLDYADRIDLDRPYLMERLLKLDIEILLRTIPALLRGRGAH